MLPCVVYVVHLTPTYIEPAYSSERLSTLEILGYNGRNILKLLTDYLNRDGFALHEALHPRYHVGRLADVFDLVVISDIADV
jgi:hypothetical protein